MPALTTAMRLPYAARRRRDSTSGQRSSPFIVEAVPSVMESPNATTARALLDALTSRASRKYQEAVLNGNEASDSSWPCAPPAGGVTYELCSALACQVIGPLSPRTWKLTA